jgi:hypothetical protein
MYIMLSHKDMKVAVVAHRRALHDLGGNFGDFPIVAPFSIEGDCSKSGAVHPVSRLAVMHVFHLIFRVQSEAVKFRPASGRTTVK